MNNLMASLLKGLRRHAPTILTAAGITGFVVAGIQAVKATPKAMDICQKLKAESETEPTTIDYVKAAGSCYIPAIGIGVASAACVILSDRVSIKRQAVLATTCSLSETMLREYQEKTIEKIGPEKEAEIRHEVAKTRAKDIPNSEFVIEDSSRVLCFDPWSSRLFTSSKNELDKIANELNRDMFDENYVSLNDFYDRIGLKRTKVGDQIGWNVARGLIDIYMTGEVTEDGKPCLSLNFIESPKYDFER